MFKFAIATVIGLHLSTFAIADTNVAEGKSVTLNGSNWGVGGWGGTLALGDTVTDGVFKGNGHIWDNDTVWWNGSQSPDAAVVINLNGLLTINAFTVEADNNDTYLLEYHSNGTWLSAWDVPYAFNGGGMQSRSVVLGSAIVTDALRFTATAGDGYYSVSEIQAFGQPVPEPETYALMLAGLGLVGFAARRRKG